MTWDAPYPAGSAVALLGHAARFDPRAVFGMLPRRLDALPPWARACLADVLSFAWWRLAEAEPEARPTLESLATPDLAGIPRSFRVFAHRGASIATLGMVSIGTVDAAATTVSMTRDPDGQLPYFYTNTRDFVARQDRMVSRHSRVGRLADALVQVVQAGHGLLENPGLDRLNGAQRMASQNALDDLVEIISGREDSLVYLRQLPRDWEAMYGVRRLLERGVRGEGITEFARAACEEHARSGTFGALHERDILLGRIALGRDDAGAAVVARIADRSPSLLGAATPGRTEAAISYIDQHPDEILTQIEAVLAEDDGVLALFHWRTHARSWQAILISEVFGRMFDSRPIGCREASRLVDQILEVVRSLPDSRLRQEYEHVYEAIDSWLRSTPVEIARAIPVGPAVQASHAWTGRLFHRANEARIRGEGAGWLDPFLWDRGLWWQTDGYSLGEGSLSRSVGGAKQIIYMFPALRLGLLAVGRTYGRIDPAGAFMTARYELMPRLERAYTAIRYERSVERLERAARELKGPVPADVQDERVPSAAGHLLLNAGRLEEAEDRLRRAAASSMIRDELRANVLYNLSCVLARAGREAECRCALEEAIHLMPHLHTSLSADEDLSSVRGSSWFVALLSDDPAGLG